ncbi:MAG TPA: hypothetical protein VHA07_05415 [Devosia sp.]|nr:hypothetical protein [Devosia sp.]
MARRGSSHETKMLARPLIAAMVLSIIALRPAALLASEETGARVPRAVCEVSDGPCRPDGQDNRPLTCDVMWMPGCPTAARNGTAAPGQASRKAPESPDHSLDYLLTF